MPVAYHINPDEGLVTITGSGQVALDDACGLGTSLLGDPDLDPALPHLVDLRGLTFDLNQDDAQAFTDFALNQYGRRIRGSVAVVIDDSLDNRHVAAIYYLCCRLDGVELFDHYDQALKWLMRREFAPRKVC